MNTINRLAGLDFVTPTDTRKNRVTMKHHFYLRPNKKKRGYAYIFLDLYSNKLRERISMKLECLKADWISDKQRLKNTNDFNNSINLQLGYIEGKINKILLNYFAQDEIINPKVLKKELFESSHRVSFYAYFSHILNIKKEMFRPGTYKRYCAVMNNMIEYNKDIYFKDISFNFLEDYRVFLKKTGRADTTVAANFSAIKNILNHAVRDGIHLTFRVDEIKPGSTKGNKIPLDVPELKRLYNYYFSEFINDSQKLIIGYFLFGCFTGMRFSDVMKTERKSLTDRTIYFITKKTNKEQTIEINEHCKKIVDNCDNLFNSKLTNQHINRELKIICTQIGIKKKVSFHTSRHTFAVNFLRTGGKVENLQILLGHSSINETMGYVYILSKDANKDIHKLDSLF